MISKIEIKDISKSNAAYQQNMRINDINNCINDIKINQWYLKIMKWYHLIQFLMSLTIFDISK